MSDATCAMPLIAFDGDGKCDVNEEALRYLESLQQALAVVSVAGKYRTGKSFLLNHVLLRSQAESRGFQVGPTTQPCTKGLWLWPQPIAQSEDATGRAYATIVIDTEGTGATNSDDTRDTRIFALALLLSSYFVYNSQGSIDEPALSSLEVVTNVSKMVRIKAKDVSPFAGAFGEEPPEDPQELGDFFPKFLWIVRDFILELRNAQGEEIDESQYLEEALHAQEDKTGVREALKKAFPKRDCATLVRPVSDESKLRMLNTMPESEMRPEFVQQSHALRAKVLRETPPKKLNDRYITGPMLAGLCRCYAAAINEGGAPVIESAWAYVCADQRKKAEERALELWDQRTTAREGAVPPATALVVLRDAARDALEVYRSGCIGDDEDAEADEALRQRLRERGATLMRAWLQAWSDLHAEKLDGILEELHKEKHVGGMQQVFDTLQRLLSDKSEAAQALACARLQDHAESADSWLAPCAQQQVREALAASLLPRLGECASLALREWEQQLRTAQEERMEALQKLMQQGQRLAEVEEQGRAQLAEAEESHKREQERANDAEKALSELRAQHTTEIDDLREQGEIRQEREAREMAERQDKFRAEMLALSESNGEQLEELRAQARELEGHKNAAESRVAQLETEVSHLQELVTQLRDEASKLAVAESKREEAERKLRAAQVRAEEQEKQAALLQRKQEEQVAELTSTWTQRNRQIERTFTEKLTQAETQLTTMEEELGKEREETTQLRAQIEEAHTRAQAAEEKAADKLESQRRAHEGKLEEMSAAHKDLEERARAARTKHAEDLAQLQTSRRDAEEAALRKEMTAQHEATATKAKTEALEAKSRDLAVRLSEKDEALTRKRKRCEELERKDMDSEGLRQQVKWLNHHHKESARALEEVRSEKIALQKEFDAHKSTSVHRLSKLEIQFGTKEEQLKEVRAQLNAAQLREERLKRENERIKEVINSAHHT